ncbi:MAG: hypothetical protein COB98_02260, partial [Flavobacteriaceae bacterium]
MIQVSENISLHTITVSDQPKLMDLMQQIYPDSYAHLWEDKGDWYLENQYNLDRLKEELQEENAYYFFVKYQGATIGIIRFIHQAVFTDCKHITGTKLHRIYLNPIMQGIGVGQELMDWLSVEVKAKGGVMVWLEAMDSQTQALLFYKKNNFQFSSDFSLDFERVIPKYSGMKRMWKY